MKSNTTWICDTCRQPVKKAVDGIVEWLTASDENGKWHGFGLRLVHRCTASPLGARRCDYFHFARVRKDKLLLHDLSLEYFLGPDGLTKLLSMLDRGEAPKGELLTMINRLHIPGYEHARPDIDRAIANGVFVPDLQEGYYWQSNLKAVLEFAKSAPQ